MNADLLLAAADAADALAAALRAAAADTPDVPVVPDPEPKPEPPPSLPPIVTHDVRVIAPQPRGDGDGRDVDNAAGPYQLNDLIGQADEVVMVGGDYEVAADKQTIEITNGDALVRSDGYPVRWVGRRGSTERPDTVYATALPDGWVKGLPSGQPLFELAAGADRLTWRGIDFADVGYGCFQIVAPVVDLKVEECWGWNVRSFLDVRGGRVDGLDLTSVMVFGHSKAAVRVSDGSRLRLTDVHCDSQWQTGDGFAMGVHLGAADGTVVDVEMHSCVAMRCVEAGPADGHWQGDGFSLERGVDQVLMVDCDATGNADAGYDLKATNLTMVDCTAKGNNRNLRLWDKNDTATVEQFRSGPLRRTGGSSLGGHIVASGEGARIGGVIDPTIVETDPDTHLFVTTKKRSWLHPVWTDGVPTINRPDGGWDPVKIAGDGWGSIRYLTERRPMVPAGHPDEHAVLAATDPYRITA